MDVFISSPRDENCDQLDKKRLLSSLDKVLDTNTNTELGEIIFPGTIDTLAVSPNFLATVVEDTYKASKLKNISNFQLSVSLSSNDKQIKETVKNVLHKAASEVLQCPFNPNSDVTLNLLITPFDTETNDSKIFKKRQRHSRLIAAHEENEFIIQKDASCTTNETSSLDNRNVSIRANLIRAPIMLQGHYLKLRRNVSQTKWLLKATEDENLSSQQAVYTSVEEIIGNAIQKHWDADSYSLHASGREDTDVRMLGSGRPFAIKLTNPKLVYPLLNLDNESTYTANDGKGQDDDLVETCLSISKVENLINKKTIPQGVQVRHLELIEDRKNLLKQIQEIGEEKQKVYGCVCKINNKYQVSHDDMKKLCIQINNLPVSQATPVRVIHRRTLAIRNRKVTCLAAQLLNSTTFVMRLLTEAGTYVKEFVHGDFGRTVPSISSFLGFPVDLIQLDVLALRHTRKV